MPCARSNPLQTAPMIQALRHMFSKSSKPKRVARVPDGERWYVIGDIHGRLDLLEALQEAIEADDAKCSAAQSTVVFLGDLVDRGPDSAGVIKLARDWGNTRNVRYLAGNHEEMFLESFEDKEVLRHFLRHGGRETVLSYGVKRKEYNRMQLDEVQKVMTEKVPADDRSFMESFEELIVVGDYVLAHAGVNPKRAVDDQKRKDLLWIRDRFLNHAEPLSHVVVHGHTIFEEIEDNGDRVGIDTGAFRTGRLTALILEGDRRRSIQSVQIDSETIEIRHFD